MFHVKHVARRDGCVIDHGRAERCTSVLTQPTVCGCRLRDPRQGGLQCSMSLRRANDDLQVDAPDASGLRDGGSGATSPASATFIAVYPPHCWQVVLQERCFT